MKLKINCLENIILMVVSVFLPINMVFSQGNEIIHSSIEQLVDQITSGESISFDFIHYGTGPLAQVFKKTTGSATILTGKNSLPGKYKAFKLTANTGGPENTASIDVILAHGITNKIDHKNKKVLISPEYRNGVELVNLQYIMPVIGLEDISNAADGAATNEGDVNINGVDCIKINHHTNEIDYSFYIGKKDNWIYKMEGSKPKVWGPATITAEFTNVNWHPLIDDSTFEVNIPEGYKVEEFTGKFPPIGSKAPDFQVRPYNEDPFNLSDLTGKVVILDFWATWCGPCLKSMKHLQEVHEKYRDNVVVIGLNWQDTKDPIPFIKARGYTYTFSNENGAAELYKANLPLAVIIDKDGNLVDFYNGYFGEESDQRLDRTISELLKR